MIPIMETETGITIFVEGKPYTISKDAVNFKDIRKAAYEGKVEEVKKFANIRDLVEIHSKGDIKLFEDGTVKYKEQEVPTYLATRVLEQYKEGLPVDNLCNFAERLMQNPNEEVREDLFKWLERAKMPISADGHFIAYKKVRNDYMSIHGGIMRNAVGDTPTMPRHECDANRNNTCSTGLHFCSEEYLPNFGYHGSDDRIMVLSVDPFNVTAIPTDYNLSKGRACSYLIIGELKREVHSKPSEHFDNPYVYEEEVATTCDVPDEEYDIRSKEYLVVKEDGKMVLMTTKGTFSLSEVEDLFRNKKLSLAAIELDVYENHLMSIFFAMRAENESCFTILGDVQNVKDFPKKSTKITLNT